MEIKPRGGTWRCAGGAKTWAGGLPSPWSPFPACSKRFDRLDILKHPIPFADIAETANDHYVVDMVLPAFGVGHDMVHLGTARRQADLVVEFHVA